MFCYILRCKIRPRIHRWKHFLPRFIWKKWNWKKKREKKHHKTLTRNSNFSDSAVCHIEGTSAIYTLGKFSLKTSIFKRSEILLRSQTGYPPYPSRQACWAHRTSACTNDFAQHVRKGASVASGLHKRYGVDRQWRFSVGFSDRTYLCFENVNWWI